MLLIFSLSNQPADISTETSDTWSGWIAEVLSLLFYRNDSGKIVSFLADHIHYVRKAAHVFEYLVLGTLTIANCAELFDQRVPEISALLCFIYAISDEIHQLFIPGRSGSITDVLIDMTGSIIGIILYHQFMKNEKKTDNSTDSSDRLPE